MNFRPYFRAGLDLPGETLPASGALKGYRSMSASAYRVLPAVNASLLKEPTAGAMLANLTEPEADHYTASNAVPFTVGTLVHAICLEPDKVTPDWMVLAPGKGLATKEARECRLQNPGKLVVTPDIVTASADITRAIWQQAEAAELLRRPGVNEVSGVLWSGGIWRKWRTDRLLTDGTRIVDVKTTRLSLERESKWEGECWNRGYWLQAAWYLDCHQKLTGIRPNCFQWIAVCTEDRRYHCRVFTVMNPAPGSSEWHAMSPLNRARRVLGLDTDVTADGSLTVSRLDLFTQSALETIREDEGGRELDAPLMRSLWPYFEHETRGPTVGLPPIT